MCSAYMYAKKSWIEQEKEIIEICDFAWHSSTTTKKDKRGKKSSSSSNTNEELQCQRPPGTVVALEAPEARWEAAGYDQPGEPVAVCSSNMAGRQFAHKSLKLMV